MQEMVSGFRVVQSMIQSKQTAVINYHNSHTTIEKKRSIHDMYMNTEHDANC